MPPLPDAAPSSFTKDGPSLRDRTRTKKHKSKRIKLEATSEDDRSTRSPDTVRSSGRHSEPEGSVEDREVPVAPNRVTRSRMIRSFVKQEDLTEGNIRCPVCGHIICVANSGCNVITCRNHSPRFVHFCLHCKQVCPLGQEYSTCECSRRNNPQTRAQAQKERNEHAKENPIEIESDPEDETPIKELAERKQISLGPNRDARNANAAHLSGQQTPKLSVRKKKPQIGDDSDEPASDGSSPRKTTTPAAGATQNENLTPKQLARNKKKPQMGDLFRKEFPGYGFFTGTVVSLPTKSQPYYGVRYSDGDCEDLTEKELLELLANEKKPVGSAEPASDDPSRRKTKSSIVVSQIEESCHWQQEDKLKHISPHQRSREKSIYMQSARKKPQKWDLFLKELVGYGYCTGTVVSLPTKSHPYYGVSYAHGASEELSEKELLELLSHKKPAGGMLSQSGLDKPSSGSPSRKKIQSTVVVNQRGQICLSKKEDRPKQSSYRRQLGSDLEAYCRTAQPRKRGRNRGKFLAASREARARMLVAIQSENKKQKNFFGQDRKRNAPGSPSSSDSSSALDSPSGTSDSPNDSNTSGNKSEKARQISASSDNGEDICKSKKKEDRVDGDRENSRVKKGKDALDNDSEDDGSWVLERRVIHMLRRDGNDKGSRWEETVFKTKSGKKIVRGRYLEQKM